MGENISNSKSFLGIEKKMSESSKMWSNINVGLSNKLKECDLKQIPDVQAEVLSNRQLVIDEINIYGVKVYKVKQTIKKLEKMRFEFYSTSYQVKLNGTEKLRLIQSDLAERQMMIDAYDNHVDFLRECRVELESLNYACKNKIEVYNILGGYK